MNVHLTSRHEAALRRDKLRQSFRGRAGGNLPGQKSEARASFSVATSKGRVLWSHRGLWENGCFWLVSGPWRYDEGRRDEREEDTQDLTDCPGKIQTRATVML